MKILNAYTSLQMDKKEEKNAPLHSCTQLFLDDHEFITITETEKEYIFF